MIPETLTDEICPAKSYGLLESIGSEELTKIDQEGGDTDLSFYMECLDAFPGDSGELY